MRMPAVGQFPFGQRRMMVIMAVDLAAFDQTQANARFALLQARNASGHWEGELSSSALSTATAVFALHLAMSEGRADASTGEHIQKGLAWLVAHQNADGGWGDTIRSFSNISTTALCWAALTAAGKRGEFGPTEARAQAWLTAHAGRIDPARLSAAIIARYGKDKTFSVPILTMCALAGRLGEGPGAWKVVPQLPFELAAFPQRWFKWLQLPVVSYALPALIAMGLVRHRRRPSANPVARILRKVAQKRALRLLAQIQPASSGFLEATPLTSFVLMSLIGAGEIDHPVVPRAVEFLTASARSDGSWPIDTNLATWVTTLAINASATNPAFSSVLEADDRQRVCTWLLDQQYQTEHPYTLANPGGWAWTDLSGGVPDADDTAGALVALQNLDSNNPRVRQAASRGVSWLLGLQNRDGGIPTFCRGWGGLPFDCSSADLTAHAIRAWLTWLPHMRPRKRSRVRSAIGSAIRFIEYHQREDGAWDPLWFGNQHSREELNPVYGTARVLKIFAPAKAASLQGFAPDGPLIGEGRPPEGPLFDDGRFLDSKEYFEYIAVMATKGMAFLLRSQNTDGGWGGDAGAPSTIEETAVAVDALSGLPPELGSDALRDSICRGVNWLIERTDRGRRFEPSPIGFYFAKLWYFEKLYPLVFAVGALESAAVWMKSKQGLGAEVQTPRQIS